VKVEKTRKLYFDLYYVPLKEDDEKWHTCMVVCDGATE